MANDSSLAGSGTQFAFDLETQQGVMRLLAAVRVSGLTSEQKSELRDLVFQYTNGGRDESVRIAIQHKVLAYGVQPLPVPQSAAPQIPPDFGSYRPLPSFSVSPVDQSRQRPVAPPVVPVASPQPAPVVPVSPPQPAYVPPPVVPPPQPVYQPQPVSVAAPVPPPEPIAVVSPPSAEPQLQVAASVTHDPAADMQRIREIKSLVNEQVGNPVHLVDIDNAVGREYMAALLDAMKKLNSGTSVISAMRRLENAYLAVEQTLKAHPSELAAMKEGKPIAPAASSVQVSEPVVAAPVFPPMPEPEPIPVFEPIPEHPIPVFEPTSEPTIQQTPTFSEPSVEERYEPDPLAVAVPFPPQPPAWQPEPMATIDIGEQEEVAEEPRIPLVDIPGPAVEAESVGVSTPVSTTQSVGGVESAWGPATDTLNPQVVAEKTKGKVASLAESRERLRSINDLLSPEDLASSSVAGDPLFTKEVDDGLQQLLSEWPLFKKSGLFGTGPKGRQHPLFMKIAPLQIPLLLAGRFEGATQEIKQSITDYMNGWRYEQGIIYEQGETFEHYLRRVIRHILDLQKKERTT